MREGFLSQYFESVAVKQLTSVEADTTISNQHEFNGTRELKRVLGTDWEEKKHFSTRFIWMGEENEVVIADSFVTWYDSRLNHPTRSEYRLYFPSTDVSEKAGAGDIMFIARRTDNTLMIIITAQGSTVENQLLWLFGLSVEPNHIFSLRDMDADLTSDRVVDFTVRFILEEIGLEVEEPQADFLDSLIQRFEGRFPSTREFSQLARETVTDVNALDDPDDALMKWLELEENLFRRLEKQIVAERLGRGFTFTDGTIDVDGFISFSLSVQNRRKSRAGLALENHLEALFNIYSLPFQRTVVTENRNKPDFLFPGSLEYHDMAFPPSLLTMLGVKTTCKERWRQVLPEANRIENKHLFTLEPGISEHQTNEMQTQLLQLVIPSSIHETYRATQRSWLISLSTFIEVVRVRSSQRNSLLRNS